MDMEKKLQAGLSLAGEETMVITFEACISKSGVTCMWEYGGSYTHIGEAMCIADKNGKPKYPMFIKTRGDLACKEHALIPVRRKDVFCVVEKHSEKIEKCKLYEIRDIKDGFVTAVTIPIQNKHMELVKATIRKSYDYHCRKAYYIKERVRD